MEHLDRLQITEGKYNYFLLCPKYYYENRGDDKACCNRISLSTSNSIKDEIEYIRTEGKLQEGYSSETERYVYKIIRIRGNQVQVGIRTKEGGKRINAAYI